MAYVSIWITEPCVDFSDDNLVANPPGSRAPAPSGSPTNSRKRFGCGARRLADVEAVASVFGNMDECEMPAEQLVANSIPGHERYEFNSSTGLTAPMSGDLASPMTGMGIRSKTARRRVSQ
jgi:hypothetical protein